MKITDFKNVKWVLTDHAIMRFRERIDPTATIPQIMKYLEDAEVKGKDTWLRRIGFLGTLRMCGNMVLTYKHIRFVAKSYAEDRRKVAIVTVLRAGEVPL